MRMREPYDEASDAQDTAHKLSFLAELRLGLSSSWYSMASALGLRRLQDYFQGSTALPTTSSPVWLFGQQYSNISSSHNEDMEQQVLSAILLKLASCIWMTYRKGFTPLEGRTSDVGWGCALRSGQMMLAQVLLHHRLGREWRREVTGACPPQLTSLLRLFWDSPGPQHYYSIHHFCQAGGPHGVRTGEWLGPWTLCHTLEALVNGMGKCELYVSVAASPGGGAPALYTQSVVEGWGVRGADEADAGTEAEGQAERSLLLLVPLVLGIGKLNARYIPQLQELLTWPQSAGIVGGRPSSSLYFIGLQDINVMYLDPHEVQETGADVAEVVETYFCSTPRMMPLANIDPSLALAFHCLSSREFVDLAARLAALEKMSDGAPLLCVVDGMMPASPYEAAGNEPPQGQAAASGENWELL